MLHMAAGMIRLISLIAIALALTISLITITEYSNGKRSSSSSSMNNEYSSSREYFEQEEIKVMPFKRRQASRFLAENEKEKNSNPRASDHCKKDNEICLVEAGGTNSTCCNKKCVDLSSDKDNCGACKNKCVYTDTCCRGECVNINYDKRHCAKCNNRCMPGGFCIYGLCDYA